MSSNIENYETQKAVAKQKKEEQAISDSGQSAGSVSLFEAEKLALKYCEQYGYARGSEEHEIAVGAFCVGFRMKQNS